jgi:hypothetical protein
MLDLPSGYILVEELTDNRQYETWQEQAQQGLAQAGFQMKYFVSDRAKALVKLALTEMGCPSIADLFHVLYELGKGIGWELNCRLSRMQKRLSQAIANQAPVELIRELQAEQASLHKVHQSYQNIQHTISTTVHILSPSGTFHLKLQKRWQHSYYNRSKTSKTSKRFMI